MPSLPTILERADPLLLRYEALLCDVWGVVHDGVRAYPAACDALQRFRAEGGTVVMLSNAPLPGEHVARVLDEKGVPREAWDAIVSSGDLTLAHVAAMGWQRLHRIGPLPRDAGLLDRLPGQPATLAEAEAIVFTGLLDDRNERAESYRPILQAALALDLPLVCANPDRVVDVGGTLLPCAGAIAEVYAEMGGAVHWAGKPYAVAYEAALARVERLRGRAIPPARVLAIGDALATDIAGAAGAGLDALLVANGIHRLDLVRDGRLAPGALAALLAGGGPAPSAAIAALAW
jgi:HAD superfamily hydrolase (TIGR01459 family)